MNINEAFDFNKVKKVNISNNAINTGIAIDVYASDVPGKQLEMYFHELRNLYKSNKYELALPILDAVFNCVFLGFYQGEDDNRKIANSISANHIRIHPERNYRNDKYNIFKDNKDYQNLIDVTQGKKGKPTHWDVSGLYFPSTVEQLKEWTGCTLENTHDLQFLTMHASKSICTLINTMWNNGIIQKHCPHIKIDMYKKRTPRAKVATIISLILYMPNREFSIYFSEFFTFLDLLQKTCAKSKRIQNYGILFNSHIEKLKEAGYIVDMEGAVKQ